MTATARRVRSASVWLTVLLIALATFRLTRFITRDQFPASVALRGRIRDRWGPDSWQAYLSECDWCSSVYVAAVVTAVTAQVVDVHAPVLVAIAASAFTGYAAAVEPE